MRRKLSVLLSAGLVLAVTWVTAAPAAAQSPAANGCPVTDAAAVYVPTGADTALVSLTLSVPCPGYGRDAVQAEVTLANQSQSAASLTLAVRACDRRLERTPGCVEPRESREVVLEEGEIRTETFAVKPARGRLGALTVAVLQEGRVLETALGAVFANPHVSPGTEEQADQDRSVMEAVPVQNTSPNIRRLTITTEAKRFQNNTAAVRVTLNYRVVRNTSVRINFYPNAVLPFEQVVVPLKTYRRRAVVRLPNPVFAPLGVNLFTVFIEANEETADSYEAIGLSAINFGAIAPQP